jgi:hypothetical protein
VVTRTISGMPSRIDSTWRIAASCASSDVLGGASVLTVKKPASECGDELGRHDAADDQRDAGDRGCEGAADHDPAEAQCPHEQRCGSAAPTWQTRRPTTRRSDATTRCVGARPRLEQRNPGEQWRQREGHHERRERRSSNREAELAEETADLPLHHPSGANTATSTRVIATAARPISARPFSGRLLRLFAAIEVSQDVLEHHDRVVDQMPMVSVSPSVERKLRLKPSHVITMNVASSVVGIDSNTMPAARGLCRNVSSTTLVSRIANQQLLLDAIERAAYEGRLIQHHHEVTAGWQLRLEQRYLRAHGVGDISEVRAARLREGESAPPAAR